RALVRNVVEVQRALPIAARHTHAKVQETVGGKQGIEVENGLRERPSDRGSAVAVRWSYSELRHVDGAERALVRWHIVQAHAESMVVDLSEVIADVVERR